MILHEGSWHIPIIRAAVEAIGGTYVEIGVRDGACFHEVAGAAREAHAVDRKRCRVHGGRFWQMTSDRFFAGYEGPADVVFIDGDHSVEQATKDFDNAMRVLSPDGVVFLHDTWPVHRATVKDTGTVWRLAAELEQRHDLNVFTYRRYPGLTVVQRPRIERF